MNRPFLNLSIVDLVSKFELSNGDLSMALELVKELRYRRTPKAHSLNKQVMAVCARSASARLFQSFLLPELEMLAASHINSDGVRIALIEVLQTRNSAKALKLLQKLKSNDQQGAQSGAKMNNDGSARITTHRPLTNAAIVKSPTAMQSDVVTPPRSSIAPDIERALTLFGVSIDASWSEVEAARQKLVFKYRPGSGIERYFAEVVLKDIADAYILLAKHMQGRG